MIKDKILNSIRGALPSTWKSASWLLKLMIPISLGVTLLQYFGILKWMAGYLNPLFTHLGLPGESAVMFLSGAMAGTYAGIAAMMSIQLTLRQATILGIMMALCHALPMECSVNRKTGSSFWKMGIIRVVAAFICAVLLNILLPDMATDYIYLGAPKESGLTDVLTTWVFSQIKMSVIVVAIIFSLMVLQRLIEEFHLMERLIRPLAPLMKVFGLPEHGAYLWLVGNVLGISYGSALMIELRDNGLITREEANDVNYHLIMNHSLLEDTIVFAITGIPALWIISTRVCFATALVWIRKLLKRSPSRPPRRGEKEAPPDLPEGEEKEE